METGELLARSNGLIASLRGRSMLYFDEISLKWDRDGKLIEYVVFDNQGNKLYELGLEWDGDKLTRIYKR